jgi:2-methylisocitrate lyase-like PEP mutase family enzyme
MSDDGSKRFRKLLEDRELILAPIVFDPLSARIAEMISYKAISLGGYAVGAHLFTTEPLTTLTEMVVAARYVASAVEIPVIVDAGAGFGEPMHVTRTVKEFERAGAAGVHIEDQVYPKRVHYHRDYRERIVSAEEMIDKIRFACKARTNKDFTIIARTDSLKTHGIEEGIRRAKLYVEAGADMIMVFPNTREETEIFPKKVDIPLVYVNSPGNRVGRPIFSVHELQQMGYKMLSDSTSVLLNAYASVKQTLQRYLKTGFPPSDNDTFMKLRAELENDCLRLPEYYSLEEQTTETAK